MRGSEQLELNVGRFSWSTFPRCCVADAGIGDAKFTGGSYDGRTQAIAQLVLVRCSVTPPTSRADVLMITGAMCEGFPSTTNGKSKHIWENLTGNLRYLTEVAGIPPLFKARIEYLEVGCFNIQFSSLLF